MADMLTNRFYSVIETAYNKFNSKGAEAIKFYCLLFIILLSFISFIPIMTIKPPCKTGTNYQNKKNCTLLGETDKNTLLDWKQDQYLAMYILNILTSSICIILAIILFFYL